MITKSTFSKLNLCTFISYGSVFLAFMVLPFSASAFDKNDFFLPSKDASFFEKLMLSFKAETAEVFVEQGRSLPVYLTDTPEATANTALSEICNNGIDDDGDGLIDAADPDCNTSSPSFTQAIKRVGVPTICDILTANPADPIGALDCDGGGQTNLDECNAGQDPEDNSDDVPTCTSTSAGICAYVTANPTSALALADCDGGGEDNLTECNAGRDPLDVSDDSACAASNCTDKIMYFDIPWDFTSITAPPAGQTAQGTATNLPLQYGALQAMGTLEYDIASWGGASGGTSSVNFSGSTNGFISGIVACNQYPTAVNCDYDTWTKFTFPTTYTDASCSNAISNDCITEKTNPDSYRIWSFDCNSSTVCISVTVTVCGANYTTVVPSIIDETILSTSGNCTTYKIVNNTSGGLGTGDAWEVQGIAPGDLSTVEVHYGTEMTDIIAHRPYLGAMKYKCCP